MPRKYVLTRRNMRHVEYVIVHSCAKLLAGKFKLRSRAKTFTVFGPDLQSKDGSRIDRISYDMSLAFAKTSRSDDLNDLSLPPRQKEKPVQTHSRIIIPEGEERTNPSKYDNVIIGNPIFMQWGQL